MARLTGTVIADGAPAAGAYVQLRGASGEFVGEVRAAEDGKFELHPNGGRWKLVSWAPGFTQVERDVEVSPTAQYIWVEVTLSR